MFLMISSEGDLPAPASTEPVVALDPSLIPSGRPGTSAGFTLEKVLEKEGSSDERECNFSGGSRYLQDGSSRTGESYLSPHYL